MGRTPHNYVNNSISSFDKEAGYLKENGYGPIDVTILFSTDSSEKRQISSQQNV